MGERIKLGSWTLPTSVTEKPRHLEVGRGQEKARRKEVGGSLRAIRGGTSTHTVGATPFALRSPVKLRIEADEVVGTRAGVTQNNFPTLLAHLTVILVIRLVAINLLLPGHCRTAQDCHTPQWRQRKQRERRRAECERGEKEKSVQ